MQADWRIFWNVGGGDVGFNNGEALAHGFRLVNRLNTYDARSSTRATFGTKTVELPLVGRHTGIFEVRGDQVTKG